MRITTPMKIPIPHPAVQQLAKLSRRDPERNVFGARKHQYRSTPVDEAVVNRLEAEIGVSLPAEYRTFVLDVGCGAGPYYGVWGPVEALAELRDVSQDYEAELGTVIRPSAPFPLVAEDLREVKRRLDAGDMAAWVERDWPCDGCLPIGHQGCTFYSVLAVTGELAGRVFDLNNAVGFCGEWMPARRPPGWWEFGMPHPRGLPRLSSPPTFSEWFAGWVERCTTDLS